MFTDNNSIIVVDDNRDSLNRIAVVFNNHGIGCKLIETDGLEGLPKEPLNGVKIAFIDINLNNQGGDNAMFATLVNVIGRIISKENGPFVIVFWTTNADKIDDFKTFVNRDGNADKISHPISIMPLDKTAFNDETLPDAIEKIYSDPFVRCLFSFNEEMKTASDNSINEILSLIKVNEPWGEASEFEKKFKELFSKIAVLSLGVEIGTQNPDKAIKESLMPVFQYSLCNNGSTCWQDFLKLNQADVKKLLSINIDYIAPTLNTIYHIDPQVSDITGRGVVRLIKNDNDLFKNKVGFERDVWVKDRFLKNQISFSDKYDLVAIEYSAACDYANQKNRLHKYMMGVLCSKNDYDKIVKKKKGLPENVYIMDFVFAHEGTVKGVLLDLNSSLSEEEGDVFGVLGEPLFQFKHELMNKITEMHANHESRIGYSYF